MVVPTEIKIALRCPYCDKIEINSLSLFEFSGTSSIIKKCSCGEELLNIHTKNNKVYLLQYYCVMCDSLHVIPLKRHQIWSYNKEGFEISCSDTAINVGFIGKTNWIKDKIKEQPHTLAEFAKQMGFTEYFMNPEIMYEILEHIYHVAENGNLYCSCGNYDLDIEIFPEYIELFCEDCGFSEIITAKTEDDLNRVIFLSKIELTENGIFDQEIIKKY
jgi:hypothetical protein